MMFAMKVWVYITGNTLSQSGSDIVHANDVIVAIAFAFAFAFAFLCVCMLVFALMLVAVAVVINDLF